MTATAADYGWFTERFPELARAYCLTLVEHLPPVATLRQLGIPAGTTVTGVAALVEQGLVGAARIGSWTLLVEPDGRLGATESVIIPLSRGTRLVSHFANADAVDHFYWVVDGDVRLHFEPLFATERDGTDPDALVAQMRRVGFDLDNAEPDDDALLTGATFALAERLTGLRLTAGLLAAARFRAGPAHLRT